MTVQDAINKVLDLARSEVGYHEKASNSQLNDKTANSGGCVHITSPTELKIYIDSSGYVLAENVEYCYIVAYSE